MPKLRLLIILSVLLCLAIGGIAKAECWRWMSNGIPAAMEYGLGSQTWMAFDEQKGEPAILLWKYQGSSELELWHYDGRTWQQTWGGYVIPPRGNFIGPVGLYFDPNQNALIMIDWILYDFEITSLMAYKYVDGQGWTYLDETMESCYGGLPIYDSKRGRAVLVLSYCGAGYYFLEFDGYKFHYIEINREEFNFEEGVAGYNPETGRVICLCNNRGYGGYGTYEYDGNTWRLVEFPSGFPSVGSIISGLTFNPSLSGMLLLSAVMSDPQNPWEWDQKMWIYKNSDWINIPFEGRLCLLGEAAMCFDSQRNLAILFGGYLELGGYSKLTWTLNQSWHCRPLGKP